MTAPSDVIRAMFAHHLWATRALVDRLESLSGAELDTAIPGTYGGMLVTLTHLVDADGRYLQRLEDPTPPPYEERDGAPLAELRRDLDEHERRWGDALNRLEAGTLHARIAGRDDYPDTDDAEVLLLLQAIHHGNDHRTQICSTLGALALEVPDLDGWEFWTSTHPA